MQKGEIDADFNDDDKDLKKWLNKTFHLSALPTVPQVIWQIRKTCL